MKEGKVNEGKMVINKGIAREWIEEKVREHGRKKEWMNVGESMMDRGKERNTE